MSAKRALVAGGLGVIGRTLVEHLATAPEWDVVGLSRRCPDQNLGAPFISVDLHDPDDCKRKLGDLTDVTHLFYAAYQEQPSASGLVAANLPMLRNLVETVERNSPALKRVVLYEGGKYYGVHLGPYKTPAKEDDPRHIPPNFYYDQEDYLRVASSGKSWGWTALRPDIVCGFAIGNPMNLTMVLAVYALIMRELGLPLHFPGRPGAYVALAQVTDAAQLARASSWAADEERCNGEAFNLTNGDLFRWNQIWPTIANFFGMQVGSVQEVSLVERMADKADVWDRLVARHGLTPYSYESVASWGFGDFVFGCNYDVISDLTKLRQFGFTETVASEKMFTRMFHQFRTLNVIPPD